MAWIESHQDIQGHPKTLDLMSLMGWDEDIAIGKLHKFWWWCLKYAEDGDLRRHNDDRLGQAVGVLPGESSKRFVEAMVKACWLDRSPYFRVHDWWDYSGMLLQIRYKHDPKKWRKVRSFYDSKHKNGSKNSSNNTTPTNQTNQPDQTKPNQPKERRAEKPRRNGDIQIPEDLVKNKDEILEWLKYKAEKGQKYKPTGLDALWRMLRAIPEESRRAAIDSSMAQNYTGIFEKKGGANGNHSAGYATPKQQPVRIVD